VGAFFVTQVGDSNNKDEHEKPSQS